MTPAHRLCIILTVRNLTAALTSRGLARSAPPFAPGYTLAFASIARALQTAVQNDDTIPYGCPTCPPGVPSTLTKLFTLSRASRSPGPHLTSGA